MAKSIESIIKRAQQLGQKTAPRSISPKEVGDLHVDTLEVIEQLNETTNSVQEDVDYIREDALPGKVDSSRNWKAGGSIEYILRRINRTTGEDNAVGMTWDGEKFNFYHGEGAASPTINGKKIATTEDLPTNVSELTNDIGLITEEGALEMVQELADELSAEISKIPRFEIKVVQSLPTQNISTTTVYLVPDTDGSSPDLYTEYIYVDGKWEQLGKVKVNLSEYYTSSEVDSKLQSKVDKEAGKGLSTNDYTTADKNKVASALPFNDTYCSDANSHLDNGYIKVGKYSGNNFTQHIPSVCTGDDRWGILFFIAENAADGTGTQMYFPIDGTYKGRVFTRSLTAAKKTGQSNYKISEWTLLVTSKDLENFYSKSEIYTREEVDEKLERDMPNEHPVDLLDGDATDLDITDVNGNVLARFVNGHIRTKNFDSSNAGSGGSSVSGFPDYISLYDDAMNNATSQWVNSSAWTWDSNGATPKAVGYSNYIRLERIYHSDKRFLRFSVAMGADTKLMIPVFHGTSATSDPTNAGEGSSCFAIDFANKKIVIYAANGYNGVGEGMDDQATGTGFNLSNELETTSLSSGFVGARTYIVEIHKDDTMSMLRIMDTLSGDSFEVAHNGWGAGRQNQYYGFYCASGVLPTISKLSVHSLNRPDVVFVGDSITEGVMVTDRSKRYPSLFRAENPKKKVVISARGGNTIADVLAKFETEYNIYRPRYMSVMIGTNSGNTVSNLTQLKELCDNIGCTLILHNITSLGRGAQVERNNMIQSVRTSLGINGAKMDVATALNYNPASGYDSNLYYTGNGTHPNMDGQKKMYQRLRIDTPELFYETISSKID